MLKPKENCENCHYGDLVNKALNNAIVQCTFGKFGNNGNGCNQFYRPKPIERLAKYLTK